MADSRERNSLAGSRSRTFVAHFSVPPLTRLSTILTFFFTTQNDHFCGRKGRWERVRLARAGQLARSRAGTLERLEMAAQKSGYSVPSLHSQVESYRKETSRGL